jgi:DNA-directed RNA polymerase beta subunit
MRVKIRLREDREPTVGDKFSSRHGQKGIVGRLVKHHDIPFLPDGSVPDLIINPHALPSRMTIGHLLESIGAKSSCLDHKFTDATPLTGVENYEKFGDRLQKHDLHRTGDELMYNPHDGRQNTRPVNLCPTYYLRLKQMVADKMAASRRGKTTNITGQPAQGRSAGGGLRIGNMESDAITANGMMSFLKESLIERSDGPAFPVHMIQGHHEIADARSQCVPLPEGLAIPNAFTCKVPKAFTVMQKELACMGISMALKTVAEDDEDIVYE